MADVADPILEYDFVGARLVDVDDPLEEDFFGVALSVEIGSEVAASIRHPLPEQFP